MTLVMFERANITLGKFMIMNSQGVTTAHFSNVKIFIVCWKRQRFKIPCSANYQHAYILLGPVQTLPASRLAGALKRQPYQASALLC